MEVVNLALGLRASCNLGKSIKEMRELWVLSARLRPEVNVA